MQAPTHKTSWKHTLFSIILVILGAFLIFFPAWLPERPEVPTEAGIVEGLQLILLFAVSAFWFGAGRTAATLRPFYQIMGALSFIAALGEGDTLIESILPIPVEVWYFPLGLYATILFLKNRRHFGAFFSQITAHPAAGFYASAFLMNFVLARFLGTSVLWKASLNEQYSPIIPQTVEAYLELLACYLLLVGTIGLCLAPRTDDPTALD